MEVKIMMIVSKFDQIHKFGVDNFTKAWKVECKLKSGERLCGGHISQCSTYFSRQQLQFAAYSKCHNCIVLSIKLFKELPTTDVWYCKKLTVWEMLSAIACPVGCHTENADRCGCYTLRLLRQKSVSASMQKLSIIF